MKGLENGMHLLENIYFELSKLGLTVRDSINLKEIRNKDGIYLYNIEYEGCSYILKYFDNDEHTREIENYSILRELKIPMIEVFNFTDRALLLEDLNKSQRYRLGIEADLSDITVARVLAEWYTILHSRGAEFAAQSGGNLYRETDIITKENIELIRDKSDTGHNHFWDLILDKLDFILNRVKSLEETLTYNDFFWTNLAVARDKKTALLFDYNLLGAGYRYGDIRNVCSSLSDEAGRAFLEVYGKINEEEKIIDEFVCHLINLIIAYKRPIFPSWAGESLNAVSSGELEKTFKKIL
jgi:hypothetical protein